MGLGLLPAPSALAYDIDVHDKFAGRSRTYLAYRNDSGSIFEVRFTTTLPGEQRRLRGQLEFIVPKSASDVMIVGRHAIKCGPVDVDEKQYEQVYGVRNILRGQTYVQKPRWTYTARQPGQHRCLLWVGTGRPRPSGTNTTSNILKVGWNSFLQVTEPLHPASAQHFQPDQPSHLLFPGKATDENVLTWTAPPGVRSFSASGDAYVTTCTSVGGSFDPVTGEYLCTGHTKIYGTIINSRMVVGQLRLDGSGYCALHYFPSKSGRKTNITRDIHHVVVFHSGSVPVATGNGCSRTFRVKVLIKNVDGGTALVHRQGTLTAAIPPT
ncbi:MULTISPECIES: hypothetical protein [Thermocrispum]|uniref:Uncharacterized protein n=1 Tax=Thermocrispum agreste TaxID=37925 RepID=A0A2W4LTF8_9PSEU|nr:MULTISPECIES: hypothetical protein [Thermocrispum]PZM98996.1 MAG: hypothetical protein DIU77_06740 [Thermocrispum agreste]